jgi:translation initiation factor 2 alpha subunit (eIF-2alpha)
MGQVVLGYLINEKEEENCLYVRIPEYDNIEGMIPKSNLPKKRRTFKRVLAKMRKDIIVPCVLKTKPRFNDDGTPWPLDLTLRRIDRDSKQVFIDRFENIGRILKVHKFVSEEVGTDFRNLSAGLWSEEIIELFADRIIDDKKDSDSDSDSNDSDDADSDSDSEQSDSPQVLSDLANLYQMIVGDHDYMIQMIRRSMDLDADLETQIRRVMTEYTHAKKSDCSIQFEFRVDDAEDPVDVLQQVFTKVLDQNPDIVIHYKGAPNYVTVKPNVSPDELEGEIESLRETFESIIQECANCSYHLKFSLQNSEAKTPTYSFSFPRLIDI